MNYFKLIKATLDKIYLSIPGTEVQKDAAIAIALQELTCPHGCVYCYAVRNQELALTRYKKHNPESDFLFEPEFPVEGEEDSAQLPLI